LSGAFEAATWFAELSWRDCHASETDGPDGAGAAQPAVNRASVGSKSNDILRGSARMDGPYPPGDALPSKRFGNVIADGTAYQSDGICVSFRRCMNRNDVRSQNHS